VLIAGIETTQEDSRKKFMPLPIHSAAVLNAGRWGVPSFVVGPRDAESGPLRWHALGLGASSRRQSSTFLLGDSHHTGLAQVGLIAVICACDVAAAAVENIPGRRC
jgi:hypothetical protein